MCDSGPMPPMFVVPGQRPIRSHSLGHSEAAAQETTREEFNHQGQRPGRSAIRSSSTTNVLHYVTNVRVVDPKHQNASCSRPQHKSIPRSTWISITPERMARWADTPFFGGRYSAFLLLFRPLIFQRDGPIEDHSLGSGIRINAEISHPFKLKAITRSAAGK